MSDVSSSAYKLPELWNGIYHPIKEVDMKFLEQRDGEPRKYFQVSAGTSERKIAKVRKCDPRRDQRSQQLSLNVTAGIIAVIADR